RPAGPARLSSLPQRQPYRRAVQLDLSVSRGALDVGRVDRGCQDLGGKARPERLEDGRDAVVARHDPELDAIGHLEAGGPPQRLDVVHELSGRSLAAETVG